jgi:hypothetical protein
MRCRLEAVKKSIESKLEPYEKYFPVIAFLGGFIWDNLTISRIDLLFDNLQLLAYLLLISVLIVISILSDHNLVTKPWLLKYSSWYPSILQFLFGGLFSVYVVFYFQSASMTKASLFLVMLAILFIANEFLKNRLSNTYLLLALHFLVSFSYFIFAVPVILNVMNTLTFLLGSIISLLLSALVMFILYKRQLFPVKSMLFKHSGVIIGVFLLVQLFYWQNWIPPVPLSMKDAGIYHHVSKQEELYLLRFEKPKWYQLFKSTDKPFNYSPSDTVFCFVSVFAPTRLRQRIFHQWQTYSIEREMWLTTDKHGYVLTGGRDGGYRGYTYKKNISPGEWRINVITDNELILGRIRFSIIESRQPVTNWQEDFK